MLLTQSLDSITVEDIRKLSGDEGQLLEYKREISDGDQLCRAVAALANGAGGIVVVGIETDTDGNIVHRRGFESTDSIDNVELSWRSKLSQRVEPNLPNVEMKFLPSDEPGRLFGIIRMRGKSALAPHWVKNYGYEAKKKTKRKSQPSDYGPQFFLRRGNQSTPMDIHDVRAAFGASRDATDILNELRDRRVETYLNGRAPGFLRSPAALCQMVPPRALTEFLHTDMERSLASVDNTINLQVYPTEFNDRLGDPEHMWNSDGIAFICDAPDSEAQRVYVQHFHSGAIEFSKVVAPSWVPSSSSRVDNLFWGRIMKSVIQYTDVIERISGSPSFYFGCSLVEMGDVKPATSGILRNDFKYPIVLVRSRETVHDDLRLIRSMLAHTVGLNTDSLQ